MVGRGIFANPAFFSTPETLDTETRLRLLRLHITRFRETWEGTKNYAILKRFFKIYANSFPGASDLRAQLMDSLDYEGGLKVLREFESN